MELYLLVDHKKLYQIEGQKLERLEFDRYVPSSDFDILDPKKHRIDMYFDKNEAMDAYLQTKMKPGKYGWLICYNDWMNLARFEEALEELGVPGSPLTAIQTNLYCDCYFGDGRVLALPHERGITYGRAYYIHEDQFNKVREYLGKYGSYCFDAAINGYHLYAYGFTCKERVSVSLPDERYLNDMREGLRQMGIDKKSIDAYLGLKILEAKTADRKDVEELIRKAEGIGEMAPNKA